MKKLTTGLSVVIFLFVLAYALAFAVNNSAPLALNFLIGEPIEWPAALWLGIALVIGVVVGVASGLLIHTKQKLQIRRLTKELHKQEKYNTRVNSL